MLAVKSDCVAICTIGPISGQPDITERDVMIIGAGLAVRTFLHLPDR